MCKFIEIECPYCRGNGVYEYLSWTSNSTCDAPDFLKQKTLLPCYFCYGKGSYYIPIYEKDEKEDIDMDEEKTDVNYFGV